MKSISLAIGLVAAPTATPTNHLGAIASCLAMLVLNPFGASPAAGDDSAPAAKSAADIAEELANPNTSLGFLALQFDYIDYQGDLTGAYGQDAWKMNFQPSLPYPIGDGINLFVRPLIPVILQQPVPKLGGFAHKGVDLGYISFDSAIGKGFSNGVQLIGGMVGTLPTATNDDLRLDQLLLGPELFIGRKTKWGFYGALVSHQWDVAGDNFSTSITGGQYFYTINLPHAWQIQAQPTWSYNHKAPNNNKLTFPLGTGISKTVVVGGEPPALCRPEGSVDESLFLIGDAGASEIPDEDDPEPDRLIDPVLVALRDSVSDQAGRLGADRTG